MTDSWAHQTRAVIYTVRLLQLRRAGMMGEHLSLYPVMRRAQEGARTVGDGTAERLLGRPTAPVSYTHLTLPTKRIV